MNTKKRTTCNECLDYPESAQKSWRPLKVFLKELGMDYRGAIGLFQFNQFIDCDHQWAADLLRRGIIQPISYVETDPHYGIETRITFDLVSPHGEDYLLNFFTGNAS